MASSKASACATDIAPEMGKTRTLPPDCPGWTPDAPAHCTLDARGMTRTSRKKRMGRGVLRIIYLSPFLSRAFAMAAVSATLVIDPRSMEMRTRFFCRPTSVIIWNSLSFIASGFLT